MSPNGRSKCSQLIYYPPPWPAAGEVRCVKVFAKGSLAISTSKDHTLCLWNLLSGQEKFTIWDGVSKDPTEPQISSLHVDEAKKVVYSASSSKVTNTCSVCEVKLRPEQSKMAYGVYIRRGSLIWDRGTVNRDTQPLERVP